MIDLHERLLLRAFWMIADLFFAQFLIVSFSLPHCLCDLVSEAGVHLFGKQPAANAAPLACEPGSDLHEETGFFPHASTLGPGVK